MHSLMRRAWVDIDLGALLRNGQKVAARAGVPLLPMVKADAYGLGAVAVVRALERLDPWGYGVATIAEGEELRRAAITRPIVVLTPLLPEDFDGASRAGLRPALSRVEDIARWSETGLPWHLSIDTGMNRAGVRWTEMDSVADVINRFPPEGAFTHFHSAKNEKTRIDQEGRFRAALARLASRPALLHTQNSAALVAAPGSEWDLVRPGVFLYGVGSIDETAVVPEPVVSVRARIVDLRTIDAGEMVSYEPNPKLSLSHPRQIATIPLGYADGYRRGFGNRGVALVAGRRASVAGFVTMDMTMLDVTGISCYIGDVATLIGRDGREELTVSEVAKTGRLSPYELLTGLHSRLPRRYLGLE
jgi:alanine racemase